MPFDGNEKKFETKPDVFSLEGLIAWLETQPGETEYLYSQPEKCLWANYISAHGGYYSGGKYWVGERSLSAELPSHFREAAQGNSSGNYGQKYSIALSRARALLATQSN